MDNGRKKVLLIPFDGVLTTDWYVNRQLCDKIKSMNVQRVAVLIDGTDDKFDKARIKSMEFFIFVYCNTAVSTHKRCDTLVEDIMALLPHNIRKKDYMLSISEKIDGIDYTELKDFIK